MKALVLSATTILLAIGWVRISPSEQRSGHHLRVEGPRSSPFGQVTKERKWLSGRLDTVRVIPKERLTRQGADPVRLRVGPAGAVVATRAGELTWVDRRGDARWSRIATSGRIDDVALTTHGVAALVGRGRSLQIYDAKGELTRTVGLERFGSILGVVPLRNGGFVLQTLAEVPPFVVVDSAGVLVGRIGAPWDGFNRLHPLARSLTVASEPGSDTWAAGFTLGDGWFVVDGAVPRKILYPYATHVEFPAVTVDSSKMQVTAELTRADIVAWTAAISGGVLTVLSEDSVSKIADRYALKGGSYLGSVRLGRRDRAIGARGDTVFVLDGAGRLVVLRVGAPARPARNQRR